MKKNLYNYINNKVSIEEAISSSVILKLLTEIKENGQEGLYKIGTKLGIRSIISKLVKRLESDGIIITELVKFCQKGRKRKVCYLTNKGLEILKEVKDMRDNFEKVEVDLRIKNRNALSKVKQVLRDILENYPEEYILALISAFVYKSKKERLNAIQKFYKEDTLKVLALLQSKGIINDNYELTIFEKSKQQLSITDEVYEFYKELWQKKYNTNYYALNTENEKSIIEKLILEFGVQETKELITKFINDNDKFLIQARHRISLIRSKILQYRTKLPEVDEDVVNEILEYYKESYKQMFNVDYVENENDLFKINDFYLALKKAFKNNDNHLDIAKSCIDLYFTRSNNFIKDKRFPISLLLAERNKLFVEYMLKNNIEVPDELKKYINLVEKVETKNENVDLDLVKYYVDRGYLEPEVLKVLKAYHKLKERVTIQSYT